MSRLRLVSMKRSAASKLMSSKVNRSASIWLPIDSMSISLGVYPKVEALPISNNRDRKPSCQIMKIDGIERKRLIG